LGIPTYTELARQPDWFIERKILWEKQKILADEHNRKVQEWATAKR
jgi:hypothetical protein